MTKYTKEVKSNVLKQYQEGTPIQLIIQNTAFHAVRSIIG